MFVFIITSMSSLRTILIEIVRLILQHFIMIYTLRNIILSFFLSLRFNPTEPISLPYNLIMNPHKSLNYINDVNVKK